ncbi:AAA family ATPase [Tepidibacter sp. Z1-5]|uniref:AAA family ATPase n=1 Tax=Tepidibacter sp. Z1-5 TaxID=3134138 RepID=UPI0030BFB3F5
MKINKLRLKNFRSYEEEVEFDFSTSDTRNIILIGGKNGAGKSTIFESIKLCIYGPLAYKYQGFNSTYINKIKSNINDNAFKNNFVDAYVSIDIELNENTEKNIYSLTRKWTFKDKKLSEEFFVYKNYSPTPLNTEEINYFENYLKSIISPKIFEFFFFDGENLSEFFIGKNSNIHLKQSLLSLCNYDTLDILKSTILSNNRTNKNDNNKISQAQDYYLSLESKYTSKDNKINDIVDKIELLEKEIEDLSLDKANLEKSFKEKGGLLAESREELEKKLNTLENERITINQKIKDFCNEMLPFLIIKNSLPKLKKQIEQENKFSVYSHVKDKLSSEFIGNILKNNKLDHPNLDEIAFTISDALTHDIKPNTADDTFENIHMLSNDESNLVLSNINTVLNFDNKEILNSYSKIESINNETNQIRKKLNSTLGNEAIDKFIKEISKITSIISEKTNYKLNLENNLEDLKFEIIKIESEKEKAKRNYTELLQTNNVVDISINLLDLIDDIVINLTSSKLREVENNFMYIFKKLIRKDKFIDSIHINSDFNVTLYIDKMYNSIDIENMLDNIGYDEMNKKLGNLFFKDLSREYKTNNKSDLIKAIKSSTQSGLLNLRTKVDLNNFSNGEKQIYILCIYWALIKASGISIPFIIDTPYARIDETHRNNITTEYFSSISNQVIILSTNTEIDFESYKQINQRISHEYLIEYDDNERKTKKSEGYFFEV